MAKNGFHFFSRIWYKLNPFLHNLITYYPTLNNRIKFPYINKILKYTLGVTLKYMDLIHTAQKEIEI
jgi:hypothetical protein